MSKIIGLDVGDKRVGVALSDPGQKFAHGVATFVRQNGKAEKEILNLIEQHKVELLVVGLPLNEGGEKTEQCCKIERFCLRLQKRAQVKVVYQDEHLTTVSSQELLAEGKIARNKSKQLGTLDRVAAALILQEYLDSR